MSADPRVRFLDRTTPPHIVTLVIISGAAAMSMNMFLPSLPSMTEYFQTDYSIMQLSVALFLVGNAIMQLMVGPLSDRFGRRKILLAGFTIFLLATVGCLFAPNVQTFLVFRVLQAASVVGMALSRAVIRDMFDANESASMIGYVTMGMALVPMIAPMLGGLLDEMFGWHSVFVAYLILGMATLWLINKDLGETNSHRGTSFRDQLRDYPELLGSPRFWGYALAAAFSAGSFFSYIGGAPFIGTVLFGLSPTVLGFLFGAPAIGYILGNYITARHSVRIGLNRLILAGSLICTVGIVLSLALFALGFDGATTFFGCMILVGLGNGLTMPNGIAGTLSVRPQLAGTASGLGGALMIGGGAALSAFAGSLLDEDHGVYPLLYLQLVVCLLGVASIIMVIRREKKLGIA